MAAIYERFQRRAAELRTSTRWGDASASSSCSATRSSSRSDRRRGGSTRLDGGALETALEPARRRRRRSSATLDREPARLRNARASSSTSAFRDGGRASRQPPDVPARARDAPLMATATLRDEAVELLQRADPARHRQPARQRDARGRAAARLPRGERRRVRALRAEPERANLVARIPGGDGPSLALLSHTDTVLADPAEWQRDPWSRRPRRRRGLGPRRARHEGPGGGGAVALASLAREGFRPAGDLIFIAAADEEVGDGVRPPVALRGASGRRPRRLRDQRGRRRAGRARRPAALPLRVRGEDDGAVPLRVHGRSGHASMPGIADNALVKAAG